MSDSYNRYGGPGYTQYEEVEVEGEEGEEYEEEDLGNEQVQNESFGYGASEVSNVPFSSDNLNYAKWRAETPYLADIRGAILTAAISEGYKNTLISCIYRLFTPTQQLACNSIRKTGRFGRVDNLQKKLLFAERDLNLAVCYGSAEDHIALNSQLLINNVLDVFESLLTRTVGEQREGVRNAEIPIRNISQTDNYSDGLDEDYDTGKKKKGSSSSILGSFFGGR